MLESPEMVLPYSPTGYSALIELFVVHVGTFTSEVGADAVGGTTPFVAVPFFGVVSPDPGDNIVGFLGVSGGVRAGGGGGGVRRGGG